VTRQELIRLLNEDLARELLRSSGPEWITSVEPSASNRLRGPERSVTSAALMSSATLGDLDVREIAGVRTFWILRSMLSSGRIEVSAR
jgi:hypothetical protein